MKRRKGKSIVISLFDRTGIMVEPWLEAGCECWIVDSGHPPASLQKGVFTDERGIRRVRHDLSTPWLYPGDQSDVAIVFAFPLPEHPMVGGPQWFKGKGLRLVAESIALFASASEFCEWMGAPYLIESPASAISDRWLKPDYTFHPFQYIGYRETDDCDKEICLWTGNNFATPEPLLLWGLDKEDKTAIASMTPHGFARAVFESNKHVLDAR